MIAKCAASSLADLSFEGAVTAHSLFGYSVEDEEDVDDLNPTRCEVKKERADFLHEESAIFWDEYISNDCNLMEAILEQSKRYGKSQGITCLYVLVILLRGVNVEIETLYVRSIYYCEKCTYLYWVSDSSNRKRE